MDREVRLPLHIALPGMDVLLTEEFFLGMEDRPPVRHSHSCFELICVEERAGVRFLLIPPLTVHLAEDVRRGDIVSIKSILITFSGPESDEMGDICGVLRELKEPVESQDSFGGSERLCGLMTALNDSRPGQKEKLEAELRLLLVNLSRELYGDRRAAAELPHTLDEERTGLLEEYFHFHFMDSQCSKSQLAAYIGVSERQLSRILEEQYHSNFSSILQQVRMSFAQALIENGETSAEMIAAAAGYPSAAAFKRAYKNVCGRNFQTVLQNRT